MTAKTISRGRRGAVAYVTSVKDMLARSVLAAMIGTVCVAPVALAQPAPLTPADFGGRWVSQEANLTLDMSRCGEDWCGVVVTNNACGHTALRAKADAAVGTRAVLELTGQLQLAAKTQAYGVRATLIRNDSGAVTLSIAGHSGGAFAAFRRTYDYHNEMVRGGDAVCQPDPKTT